MQSGVRGALTDEARLGAPRQIRDDEVVEVVRRTLEYEANDAIPTNGRLLGGASRLSG